MNKYITFLIIDAILVVLGWHGLVYLFGEPTMVLYVKIVVATLGIGFAIWLIATIFGGPIVLIYSIFTDIRIRAEIRRGEVKKIYAEVRQIESHALWRAETNRDGVAFLNTDTGESRFYYKPNAGQIEPIQAVEENKITALDVMLRVQRAFIWGATRSGKSHFCKTLAYYFIQRGNIVLVIDPEYADPKDPWPVGTVIFGTDDDWEAIAKCWMLLFAMRDERSNYVKKGGNIEDFPEVYIFFDEINEVLSERDDFTKPYLKVFRRFSKYRIYLICLGQTDDVESIGFKGKVKLKYSFDVILQFHHDKKTDERKSYADFQDGQGKIELLPYQPVPASQRKNVGGVGNTENLQIAQNEGVLSAPDISDKDDEIIKIAHNPTLSVSDKLESGNMSDTDIPDSADTATDSQFKSEVHRKICHAWDAGDSPTAIVKSIVKDNPDYKPNTRDVDDVRAVLRQYGRNPDPRPRVLSLNRR